ncbi:DUF4132 domain-containing protein [Actinomadura rubrisoli]|uniref:DUF4132 domain-containing protein n=1 Tax=Actinomadura rubrisoli TaxID=2530368 RepID=A0A4R5C9X7_9ACTN|nr:DUF4132 domain-containing protein [Actinomadura rubrisoli]
MVRRLIWLAEEGTQDTAFRLAEDRTFTDVHDDAFTPPGSAAIRIAHPLDLGDTLRAWRATLDDYETLQPFPQIRRTGPRAHRGGARKRPPHPVRGRHGADGEGPRDEAPWLGPRQPRRDLPSAARRPPHHGRPGPDHRLRAHRRPHRSEHPQDVAGALTREQRPQFPRSR